MERILVGKEPFTYLEGFCMGRITVRKTEAAVSTKILEGWGMQRAVNEA